MTPIIGSTRPAGQSVTVRGGGRPDAYRGKDGKKFPSVTTVIGRFKESGGLIRWAYEQGQRKERGEIDDLYDSRDQAAKIGGMVHDIAESITAGDEEAQEALARQVEELPDEQRVMVNNGVMGFNAWLEGSRFTIVETETPLVSEAHGFAGTFDALARDQHGRLVLIDYKSSAAIYGDYIVQLGAYAILLEERGDPVEYAHLCRFDKTWGNFAAHQITGPMLSVGRAQFLLLLDAYKNDALLKRMVK